MNGYGGTFTYRHDDHYLDNFWNRIKARFFPRVRFLKISGNSNLIQLAQFARFHKLQALEIEDCESLTDITGLRRLTNLRSLRIYQCHSLKNLEGIHELENLTELSITSRSLKLVGRLAELSKLKFIYIAHYPDSDVQWAIGMTSLDDLTLVGCPSLNNLQAIAGSKTLRMLTLVSCERLELISLVDDMENLKYITIDDCPFLKRVDFSGVGDLQVLSIKQCDRIGRTEIDQLKIDHPSAIIYCDLVNESENAVE